MDQPAGGGVGAVRLGAGRPGPGPFNNQRGAGGAPPHRRRGGHRGPRGDSHQLQGGEAAHAPQGLVPGRPAGSHLRGLQHVRGHCGLDSPGSRPPHSAVFAAHSATRGNRAARVCQPALHHQRISATACL